MRLRKDLYGSWYRPVRPKQIYTAVSTLRTTLNGRQYRLRQKHDTVQLPTASRTDGRVAERTAPKPQLQSDLRLLVHGTTDSTICHRTTVQIAGWTDGWTAVRTEGWLAARMDGIYLLRPDLHLITDGGTDGTAHGDTVMELPEKTHRIHGNGITDEVTTDQQAEIVPAAVLLLERLPDTEIPALRVLLRRLRTAPKARHRLDNADNLQVQFLIGEGLFQSVRFLHLCLLRYCKK